MAVERYKESLLWKAAVRRAYELAHDAEYALFSAHLFRDLPYQATAGLYEKVYEIKRLIVAAEASCAQE
jgi:hypothetical protein